MTLQHCSEAACILLLHAASTVTVQWLNILQQKLFLLAYLLTKCGIDCDIALVTIVCY